MPRTKRTCDQTVSLIEESMIEATTEYEALGK
jgi:hypothetical protein